MTKIIYTGFLKKSKIELYNAIIITNYGKLDVYTKSIVILYQNKQNNRQKL